MTSTQRILAIVLVLQLALTGVIYWSQRPAEIEAGSLLEAFEPADVDHLVIEDGDGGLVDLTKEDGAWALASSGGYPANQEAVSGFLGKLQAIQSNRLVTQTSVSHKRLQVADDDFRYRVILELTDGTRHELLIGSSPNPRSLHVRLSGRNEVFATGELLAHETSTALSSWIDTSYVTLDRDLITKMRLENSHGTFELVKADDAWSFSGIEENEESSQSGPDLLLGQLTNLRLVAPLGTEALPEYGLDDPLAILKITTEESGEAEEYSLLIGAHDAADNTYVAKWSGSPFYVTVSGFAGDALVNADRGDFVTELPVDDIEEIEEDIPQEDNGI